jgi:predicted flap endonuclease-1-like 5' DNA nuclease
MPPIELRTQSTVWYLALPVFEKFQKTLPLRKSFTSKINKVCKERFHCSREEFGIVAKPRATMYYNGNWYPVSYEAVSALAKNGTDIIFIEKVDIVNVLCGYADTYGIALVDTEGAFVDYGRDLVEEAQSSGANVAVLTDFDAAGIKMAHDAGDIPRLGIDDDTLEYFGLSRDTPNLVVPHRPKIDMMSRILGLVDNDVLAFLKHNKIEIDAILAVVGNERLWEYLMDKLQEYFPTRDLTRVISATPELSSFLPEDIRNERNIIREYISSIVSEEEENTREELENFEGITEIIEKRQEIEKRHGAIVEKDELLKELAAKHAAEVKPILDKIVKKKEEDHQARVKKIQEEEARQAKEKAELIKKYGDICSKYNLEIQDVEGIGPTSARKLKEIGIASVIDLAVTNADDLGPKLGAPFIYDVFARDEEDWKKTKNEKIKAARENASKFIEAAKKLLEDKLKEEDK